MVTALALILDAALAFAVWLSVPGSGRLRGRREMPQPFLCRRGGARITVHFRSAPRTQGPVAYGRAVSASHRSEATPCAWPILTWRAH